MHHSSYPDNDHKEQHNSLLASKDHVVYPKNEFENAKNTLIEKNVAHYASELTPGPLLGESKNIQNKLGSFLMNKSMAIVFHKGEEKPADYGDHNEQQFHEKNYINSDSLSLDEPISTTILNEIKGILIKLKYILYPGFNSEKERYIKDWDFWGPLIFAIMFGLALTFENFGSSQSAFSTVFLGIFGLSTAVVVNCKLLGMKMSYLSSISFLGYCVGPIAIADFLMAFISSLIPGIIRFLIIGVATLWSISAASAFVQNILTENDKNKKYLVLYPIIYFYVFIGSYGLNQSYLQHKQYLQHYS